MPLILVQGRGSRYYAPPGGGTPAWANRKGFNFRANSDFVTDGTGDIFVGTEANERGPAYPTNITTDGDNFNYGWPSVTGNGSRDRDDTVDPRLAGLHFKGNDGTQVDFRVDVPPGVYTISLAIGDVAGGTNTYLQILDDSAARITLTALLGDPGVWFDAQGTAQPDAATWVSSQVPVTGVVIASGILKMRLGSATSQSHTSHICHMSLTQTS